MHYDRFREYTRVKIGEKMKTEKSFNKSFNIRLISLLLVISIMLSLTACNMAVRETADEITKETVEGITEETGREFTDSTGRNVIIPEKIEKIAVSGPLAQMFVFALCPDKLVGLAGEWDSEAEKYIDQKYMELPLLGQLYGGKGELNLETLLSSGAQVVIDIGNPKNSIKEDMDSLQEQTGIPFVHISAYTDTLDDAYRMLGKLLGMEEEAEVLASYCEKIYDRTGEIASSVDKAKLLYIAGDKGLNVIAKDSYHSEVIDMLSDNLAVLDEPSSRGSGNEVDIEQILNWNPDVILVAPDSVYDTIGDDPLMQNVTAIKNGAYYEVPYGPYNWMGFPPSIQRLLGMMWMAKLLYPDKAEYDLCKEVTEYYKLFYHCDLTEDQYNELVINSIGKQ